MSISWHQEVMIILLQIEHGIVHPPACAHNEPQEVYLPYQPEHPCRVCRTTDPQLMIFEQEGYVYPTLSTAYKCLAYDIAVQNAYRLVMESTNYSLLIIMVILH